MPDYSGKGPKGYVRSDERIHYDVCQALHENIWVDASEIEVRVDHGFVWLSGEVTDRKQKKEAERCIENLAGVKDVINYLELKQDHGLIGEMAIKANMV